MTIESRMAECQFIAKFNGYDIRCNQPATHIVHPEPMVRSCPDHLARFLDGVVDQKWWVVRTSEPYPHPAADDILTAAGIALSADRLQQWCWSLRGRVEHLIWQRDEARRRRP